MPINLSYIHYTRIPIPKIISKHLCQDYTFSEFALTLVTSLYEVSPAVQTSNIRLGYGLNLVDYLFCMSCSF
jgi:hypothetical protein